MNPNPAPGPRHVIPPAVQASRMQRYALYLMVCSFLLVGVNYQTLTIEKIMWYAAGLTAVFALLCATCAVILHGIAWNFDRLRVEMRGGPQSRPVGTPDPSAPRRPGSGSFDPDDVPDKATSTGPTAP